MCGRSTYKLTREETVAIYRLTLDQPARNTQARYNVCPTTTIDTTAAQNGKRKLVDGVCTQVSRRADNPLGETSCSEIQRVLLEG
jgi:putative SOS response-associated peptidase YedK